MALFLMTFRIALCRLRWWYSIRYASTKVEDRLIPMMQCTSTFPDRRQSLMGISIEPPSYSNKIHLSHHKIPTFHCISGISFTCPNIASLTVKTYHPSPLTPCEWSQLLVWSKCSGRSKRSRLPGYHNRQSCRRKISGHLCFLSLNGQHLKCEWCLNSAGQFCSVLLSCQDNEKHVKFKPKNSVSVRSMRHLYHGYFSFVKYT